MNEYIKKLFGWNQLYFITNKVIVFRVLSCLKKTNESKETIIKFKIINITLVQFKC